MNQLGILRLVPLLVVPVLLMTGCGAHEPVTGITPDSSGAGPAISTSIGDTGPPSMEGAGPESPQSATNGGISVSVAGLPIGQGPNRFPNGNDECIQVSAQEQQVPDGVTVTVTAVVVLTGLFTAVNLAATDCPEGPACVNFQYSAASIDGASCYAGVEYTGPPPTTPEVSGTLELVGELSCRNVDPATCRRDGASMQNTGDNSISFDDEPSSSQPAGSGTIPPQGSGSP